VAQQGAGQGFRGGQRIPLADPAGELTAAVESTKAAVNRARRSRGVLTVLPALGVPKRRLVGMLDEPGLGAARWAFFRCIR
jgi:hypothetical protein